jgi:hypothetical protein
VCVDSCSCTSRFDQGPKLSINIKFVYAGSYLPRIVPEPHDLVDSTAVCHVMLNDVRTLRNYFWMEWIALLHVIGLAADRPEITLAKRRWACSYSATSWRWLLRSTSMLDSDGCGCSAGCVRMCPLPAASALDISS